MTGRILPIDKFTFPNFNLTHFETLLAANLLENPTFTTVEDWEPLPPGTLPMTYIDGQSTGNKYGVLKGAVRGIPTQIYLGVQNLYSNQKLEDVDYWEYPEKPQGWYNSNTRVLGFTPKYYLYVEVDLPYTLPHIRVHPNPNFKSLTDAVNVKLEGNFHEFFTIETTEQDRVSAYEILPPDTMVQLLDVIPTVGLEYVKNKLYISIPVKHPWRVGGDTLKFNKTWEITMAEIFAVISSIPELADSAKTASIPEEEFQPIEQVWNNSKDPEGAKRKRNKLVAGASIVFTVIFGGGSILHFASMFNFMGS